MWEVHCSPTEAPVIGRVLPSQPGLGAAGVSLRQSGWSLDSLFMGDFHVAAGSVVGAGHLTQGSPRQDAYDLALTPAGHLVLAIADGMGSRPHSQAGARLFCEGVTRLAAADTGQTASGYLIKAAAGATHQAQTSYGLDADAISFVAAVAVVRHDGYQIARVGDVSAFTLSSGTDFTELFDEPRDTHINVVLASLPSAQEPVPDEVTGMPPQGGEPQVLLLTTDGLAGDLRTSEKVRTWLSQCWRAPTDAWGMGEALRYRRQGSHDDRTAVVVSYRPTE